MSVMIRGCKSTSLLADAQLLAWLTMPKRYYIMSAKEEMSRQIKKKRPPTREEFEAMKKKAMEGAALIERTAAPKPAPSIRAPTSDQLQEMYARKVAALREQVAGARRRNKETEKARKISNKEATLRKVSGADAPRKEGVRSRGSSHSAPRTTADIEDREHRTSVDTVSQDKGTKLQTSKSSESTQPGDRTEKRIVGKEEDVRETVSDTEVHEIKSTKFAPASFHARLRPAKSESKKLEEEDTASGIMAYFDKRHKPKRRQQRKTKLSLLKTSSYEVRKRVEEPNAKEERPPVPQTSGQELAQSEAQYLKKEGIDLLEVKVREGRKPRPITPAKLPTSMVARAMMEAEERYRRSRTERASSGGNSPRDEVCRYLKSNVHNGLQGRRHLALPDDEVLLVRVAPKETPTVALEEEAPPVKETQPRQWAHFRSEGINKYLPSEPIGLVSSKSQLDRNHLWDELPTVRHLLGVGSAPVNIPENEYDTTGSRFLKMSADLVSKSKNFWTDSRRFIGDLLTSGKHQ